jgi:hypothetical protein
MSYFFIKWLNDYMNVHEMFIDGSILSRQQRSSGRSCGSSKVLGSMGPRWPKPFYVLAVLLVAPIPFHPIPLVYLSFVAYLQILHIWQIPMAPSHGICTHFIFVYFMCPDSWGVRSSEDKKICRRPSVLMLRNAVNNSSTCEFVSKVCAWQNCFPDARSTCRLN